MTGDRKRIPEVLAATPEVRKDKIDMLKKAIADGTYVIKGNDIANKILRDLLLEHALKPACSGYAEKENKSFER